MFETCSKLRNNSQTTMSWIWIFQFFVAYIVKQKRFTEWMSGLHRKEKPEIPSLFENSGPGTSHVPKVSVHEALTDVTFNLILRTPFMISMSNIKGLRMDFIEWVYNQLLESSIIVIWVWNDSCNITCSNDSQQEKIICSLTTVSSVQSLSRSGPGIPG